MDIIDTRDLQEEYNELMEARDQIEELESQISDLEDEIDELDELGPYGGENADEELDTLREKLDELIYERESIDYDEDRADEIRNIFDEVPDAEYGATLIEAGSWVEYVKELCEDVGDIPRDLPHYIENAFDWEKVADEIVMDYGMIDFDGNTYYYRNC